MPRVLANRIDAGHSNPPQRVLNDVARRLVVILVQIGEDIDEPAFERLSLHLGYRVRIVQHPGLENVRQVMLFRPVVPGRRR